MDTLKSSMWQWKKYLSVWWYWKILEVTLSNDTSSDAACLMLEMMSVIQQTEFSKLPLVTHLRILDNEVSGTWMPLSIWLRGWDGHMWTEHLPGPITCPDRRSFNILQAQRSPEFVWLYYTVLAKSWHLNTGFRYPCRGFFSSLTNLPSRLFHEKRKQHRSRASLLPGWFTLDMTSRILWFWSSSRQLYRDIRNHSSPLFVNAGFIKFPHKTWCLHHILWHGELCPSVPSPIARWMVTINGSSLHNKVVH